MVLRIRGRGKAQRSSPISPSVRACRVCLLVCRSLYLCTREWVLACILSHALASALAFLLRHDPCWPVALVGGSQKSGVRRGGPKKYAKGDEIRENGAVDEAKGFEGVSAVMGVVALAALCSTSALRTSSTITLDGHISEFMPVFLKCAVPLTALFHTFAAQRSSSPCGMRSARSFAQPCSQPRVEPTDGEPEVCTRQSLWRDRPPVVRLALAAQAA